MMLGFHPKLNIDYDWAPLTSSVERVARDQVHTGRFVDRILYDEGASQVAEIDGGGWISKSRESYDFFVMGGIQDTKNLDIKFQKAFPEFTFTPATICWTSRDIPRHRDSPKNGQCSLVYPLYDHRSIGMVIDPENKSDFFYSTRAYAPVIINITQYHQVYVKSPRIWFSIHIHEPIELVKEVFDKLGPITV